MKRIYVDNAATTPVSASVSAAMQPFLHADFGNPSALYREGRSAKHQITAARRRIADALCCRDTELSFTSGGTEAINWAVKGAAFAYFAEHGHPGHLVTTQIEHAAVLHTMQFLETLGFSVTYVRPEETGVVSVHAVECAMRTDTFLVAVMFANNEIGTIQPVQEIADLAHRKGALFFCDAVQAIGQIPVDLSAMHADMVSISGHKFHAPKGIGLLYCKDGTALVPLLDGGGQERGQRSGTENVPYIAGLAQAVEDAVSLTGLADVAVMRDVLFDGLTALPGCIVNGTHCSELRLPGNVNVSFPGLHAESMVLLLDAAGICASSGSACHAGSYVPSHVLTAIGRNEAAASSSLRFTISKDNTIEEMQVIVQAVRDITARLRSF